MKVRWLLLSEHAVFVVKVSILFDRMVIVIVLQRKEYLEEKQIMQVA